MFAATAEHEHTARSNGSSALMGSEDKPAHDFAEASGQRSDFTSNMSHETMSPEERRKKVAEWLIAWLKEGDPQLAVN
jgi:hypothetical protein